MSLVIAHPNSYDKERVRKLESTEIVNKEDRETESDVTNANRTELHSKRIFRKLNFRGNPITLPKTNHYPIENRKHIQTSHQRTRCTTQLRGNKNRTGDS